VLSVLNFQPDARGICPFHRSIFAAFLQQTLSVPAIAVVQLLISYGVYVLIQRRRRLPADRARWLVRPLFALALSLYTPVTSAVFGMLWPRQIGAFTVLAAAPAQVFLSAQHRPFFALATVLAVLFVLGFPLVLLVAVIRNRRRIGHSAVVALLGFVYEAYRPSVYWWEVVVLVRRMVIAAVGTAMVGNARALGLTMLCIAFAVSQMYVQPMHSAMENASEVTGLGMLIVLATLPSFIASSLSLALISDALTGATALVMLSVAVWMARDTLRGGVRAVATLVSRRFSSRPFSVGADETASGPAAEMRLSLSKALLSEEVTE
jgi:hypothetical protein